MRSQISCARRTSVIILRSTPDQHSLAIIFRNFSTTPTSPFPFSCVAERAQKPRQAAQSLAEMSGPKAWGADGVAHTIWYAEMGGHLNTTRSSYRRDPAAPACLLCARHQLIARSLLPPVSPIRRVSLPERFPHGYSRRVLVSQVSHTRPFTSTYSSRALSRQQRAAGGAAVSAPRARMAWPRLCGRDGGPGSGVRVPGRLRLADLSCRLGLAV